MALDYAALAARGVLGSEKDEGDFQRVFVKDKAQRPTVDPRTGFVCVPVNCNSGETVGEVYVWDPDGEVDEEAASSAAARPGQGTGAFVAKLTGLNSPRSVAVAPENGLLLVCENGRDGVTFFNFPESGSAEPDLSLNEAAFLKEMEGQDVNKTDLHYPQDIDVFQDPKTGDEFLAVASGPGCSVGLVDVASRRCAENVKVTDLDWTWGCHYDPVGQRVRVLGQGYRDVSVSPMAYGTVSDKHSEYTSTFNVCGCFDPSGFYLTYRDSEAEIHVYDPDDREVATLQVAENLRGVCVDPLRGRLIFVDSQGWLTLIRTSSFVKSARKV
jgi:hypothetical protein